jgi:hypothetical protein
MKPSRGGSAPEIRLGDHCIFCTNSTISEGNLEVKDSRWQDAVQQAQERGAREISITVHHDIEIDQPFIGTSPETGAIDEDGRDGFAKPGTEGVRKRVNSRGEMLWHLPGKEGDERRAVLNTAALTARVRHYATTASDFAY